jgi:hypothetical protein
VAVRRTGRRDAVFEENVRVKGSAGRGKEFGLMIYKTKITKVWGIEKKLVQSVDDTSRR